MRSWVESVTRLMRAPVFGLDMADQEPTVYDGRHEAVDIPHNLATVWIKA